MIFIGLRRNFKDVLRFTHYHRGHINQIGTFMIVRTPYSSHIMPVNDNGLFILAYQSEQNRMVQMVVNKNQKRYQQGLFLFLNNRELDEHLIVARTPDLETPQLGEEQYGLFAGRDYVIGQRIAEYEGERPWGIRPHKEISEQCELYKGPGDYMWQVNCNPTESTAIDSRIIGSSARFVNESAEPNAEIAFINGRAYYIATRNIKFGDEITTTYGLQYYEENQYINRKPLQLIHVLNYLYPSINWNIGITNLAGLEGYLIANHRTFARYEKTNAVLTIEQSSDEIEENLYFGQNRQSLFISNDQPSQSNFNELCRSAGKQKIELTSRHPMVIVPMLSEGTTKKFGLFARGPIKAKSTLCEVKGKFIKNTEMDYHQINNNYYQVDHGYINSNEECSEANFVQPADREHANAKLIVNRKGAFFESTRAIKPGELISANFYSTPSIFQSIDLGVMIKDNNSTQNEKLITYKVENDIIQLEEFNPKNLRPI